MDWLFPSVVATLISCLVLTATYFYLYTHDRRNFLFVWGCSWLVYSLRFLFMLCALQFPDTSLSAICVSANKIAALISGYLLISGTYMFNRRKISPLWKILLVPVVVWIIIGNSITQSFLFTTLPVFLYLGIAYIITGSIVLRSNRNAESGQKITGTAFILWGVHKLDYPFIRPLIWLAPWGYVLGASLQIIVALGMMIIYFNRSRMKIRESEQRFRQLIAQTPLPLAVVDLQDTVKFLNKRFTSTFGYTSNDLPTLKEWWPCAFPDEAYRREIITSWTDKVAYALASGGDIEEAEYHITSKDGRVHNVLVSGTIIEKSLLIILRDITEQQMIEAQNRELESRLYHMQKMEAIGTLAGGIAHDFNNILGGIMGYTDMSLHNSDSGKQQEYLRKSLAACERAKKLIGQLLTFSRRQPEELVPVLICPIIIEALELLKASLPSSVEITSSFKSRETYVMANPGQIHESIINLCTNAAQSMHMRGTMTVECIDREITVPQEGRFGTLQPGMYSVIRIADTGCGIDPETLERIFEPFFTTKEQGKGTGLGLSVVFGVVKNHNGNITVESRPGYGSAFTIYLPETREETSHSDEKPTDTPAGTETILLLDDEELFLDTVTSMLTSLGYTVHPFMNSQEALLYLENNADSVEVILTDLTMPKLNGIEFAQKATGISGNIPVLLCTGNNEIPFEKATMEKAGIRGVLKKPFTLCEVATSVRNVLQT